MENEKVISRLKQLLVTKRNVGDLFDVEAISCALNVFEEWDYNNKISALEQQRWIPVSEKLPEKQTTIGEYVFSEKVLGTEGFTIRKAYYNYTTKEWFDGNEEQEWTEITHWMPLPTGLPPYKEDAE